MPLHVGILRHVAIHASATHRARLVKAVIGIDDLRRHRDRWHHHRRLAQLWKKNC